MGPLVLLPSVHLGLSGGFVFTGEASGQEAVGLLQQHVHSSAHKRQ